MKFTSELRSRGTDLWKICDFRVDKPRFVPVGFRAAGGVVGYNNQFSGT